MYLRLKPDSPLALTLEALGEAGDAGMTKSAIADVFGEKGGDAFIRKVASHTDNVATKLNFWDEGESVTSARYVDVSPPAAHVTVDRADLVGGMPHQPQAGPEGATIVWCDAPPLINPMDNFDKPTWYERMRVMTMRGKHTSLQGPPGVGKDTAVQQLAALEKQPLVTLGGEGSFQKWDLAGQAEIAAGTSYWESAEYATAVVKGYWVLLTEINAAYPDALMYLNPQLAPPYTINIKGRAYPVHPNFRLFVSYNYGLAGTQPPPASLKDRFHPIKMGFFTKPQLRKRLECWRLPVEDGMDFDAWQWGETIVNYGIAMWAKHESGGLSYQITTRRLIDAIDLMLEPELNYENDVKRALRHSVLEAIDNPHEAQTAADVLRSV
jgi:hypothetical protein